MTRDRVRRTVLVELADARTQGHSQGERRPSAGGMDDARPGEVDRTMTEVQRRAEVREPPATPQPHAVDGVDDGAHRGERDPFRDGADDDVAGGLHEDDLEQEQHHHADVVAAVALEQEPVQADDSGAAVTEDAGQRRDAAEIRDRCDPAEHEGETDGVIREQRDRERGDVHHHHVAGVLCPGETRDQEREADLHEQHQEAGDQRPGEVDGDTEMADVGCEAVDADLRHRHVGSRFRIVAQAVERRARGVGRCMVAPHRAQDDDHDERHQAHRDELLT